MKPTIWHGCYDSSWSGIITPESFAHPAKFARGLIERIFDHCLAKGYLRKGDRVGDPFGGIGTGGVTAAYRGLHWIGCELELRFVDFAKRNFALHTHGWAQTGKGSATIIQGDSRKFAENVAGVVTSPPYADSIDRTSGIDPEKVRKPGGPNGNTHHDIYGEASGQIGSLKSGQVDSVISSPPYAGIAPEKNGSGPDLQKQYVTYRASGGGASFEKFVATQRKHSEGYGHSNGQISTLKEGTVAGVISSPPYIEGLGHGDKEPREINKTKSLQNGHYGESPGQTSQLKGGSVEGVVSSPPFESSLMTIDTKFMAKVEKDKRNGSRLQPGLGEYGQSEGQIGKESGETYWQAVDAVYRSCFQAIKPGGVIVLVVKDYCQKGKRVRLCDDTMRLLEHIGFQPLERIHAMLVSETVEHGLDGQPIITKRQRKSFFRRLYEQKLPEGDERRIDHEEVIICRRP